VSSKQPEQSVAKRASQSRRRGRLTQRRSGRSQDAAVLSVTQRTNTVDIVLQYLLLRRRGQKHYPASPRRHMMSHCVCWSAYTHKNGVILLPTWRATTSYICNCTLDVTTSYLKVSCNMHFFLNVTHLHKMGDKSQKWHFSSPYLSINTTLNFKNLQTVCQCVNYNPSYCILKSIL